MELSTIASEIAHPMILTIMQGIVANALFEIARNRLKTTMDRIKLKKKRSRLYLYVLIIICGLSMANIGFSAYEIWDRYGNSDKSVPATVGDVMFLSSHIGGVFLSLSVSMMITLFSIIEKTSRQTMDWLCTVYRCPGCDVQFDPPVWPVK